MRYRLSSFLLAITIGLALVPMTAEAQFTPSTGDRIRVTQADGSIWTGEVRTWSGSEIQLLDEELDGVLAIPTDEILGIERSLGEQGSFGKTLFATIGIGAGVGFFLVGPFLPVCEQPSYGPCSPGSRGTAMAQGMVLGGLIAIPVGVILGASRKTERWAPVSTPGTDDTFSFVAGMDGSVGGRITFPVGGGS